MNQEYQSVTVWQGHSVWHVEVTVGGFKTAQAAALFGSHQAKRLLRHEQGADHLLLLDSSGNHHKIEQEQVATYKMKEESKDKLMIDGVEDFQFVYVSIKYFSITEGLNKGFGSLAYGVNCDGHLLPFDTFSSD